MKSRILLIILTLFSTYFIKSQSVKFPHSVDIQDVNGKIYNTSTIENNGKPIIIDFWASYCKPCIIKYNTFKDIYTDWQKKTGVKIIIVSIDENKRISLAKKLMKKYDWPFDAYFDPNQEFIEKLIGRGAVPRSVIFDKNFNIALKKSGAKIFSSKHPNDLSKAINDIYVKQKPITKEYRADISDYIRVIDSLITKK